ncbi:MAG: universal stress protein [Pseudomonadota bacterium]
MYKKILVPIDLTHQEKGKAMIGVASQVKDAGGDIILATVVPDIPPYVVSDLPAGFFDNQLTDALSELKAIANAAGIGGRVIARSGHPANTIMAIAEEEECDLIIIASHRPGLQDYFLGSTAARVVRHAKCSVLITR